MLKLFGKKHGAYEDDIDMEDLEYDESDGGYDDSGEEYDISEEEYDISEEEYDVSGEEYEMSGDGEDYLEEEIYEDEVAYEDGVPYEDEVSYEDGTDYGKDACGDEPESEDGVVYADEAVYEGDETYGGEPAYAIEEELPYGDETACGDGESYGEDGLEYAAEDGAVYEDGVVYEGEAAYGEETVYEDGVVYEDDAFYEGAEEFYEADGYYEDEEAYYADAEEELEFEEEEDGHKIRYHAIDGNFFQRTWDKILNMSAMDRIITVTGVAVLIMALVTGSIYLGSNMSQQQVSSFEEVGGQLDGITMIGEKGLMAVADAEMARLNAANAVEDEEEDDNGSGNDYDEQDYVNEVTVALNMTSIQKDLKIKFTNKKTGRLIAGVPFRVEVTGPDGKSEVWTDEDKDGIVYKKGIVSGKYKVAMQALEEEKYKDYQISTASVNANVKDTIAYEKVDVSDEVKKESEIDASKEDTAQNEVAVESELKDTVVWVESTANAIYVEVPKSEVKAPATASVGTLFTRLAEVTQYTVTLKVGESYQIKPEISEQPGWKPTLTWKVNDEADPLNQGAVTVDAAGNIKGVRETKGSVTVSCTYSWTKDPDAGDDSVSGGDGGQEENPPSGGTLGWTVTVKPADPPADPVVTITGITLNKSELSLAVAAEETLAVSVTHEPADAVAPVVKTEWKSGDETVATVDSTGKVKGIKAGKATITAAVTVTVGEGDKAVTETKTLTCEVTVTEAVCTELKLDKDKLTVAVAGTAKLVPTTTPAGGRVTWVSDKPDIATVAEDGTITGVKEGTAVITATCGTLTAKCTVTVSKLMTLDKTTATVYVGGEVNITVTVADDGKGTVTAASADTGALTVSVKDKVVTLKGVSVKNSVGVTIAYTTASGKLVSQDVFVSVVANNDATALTDKQNQPLLVKLADGSYAAAKASDYYKYNTFWRQTVKYTGWQTLGGNLYYYDVNGRAVTGEQVIQGAKYNFASDGSLITGNGTMGIDVSKWNGTIDWNAVKNSGVSYVIIRCGYRGSSQGALVEDPKFKTNIKGATAAGLKVGVYFFSQAIDEVEAVEEASMVLGLIRDYKISYPVFLDVEGSGGRGDKIDSATRTKVITAFCQTIQNSGYTAGVYANKSWLEGKMDATQLTRYKIWLAQYAAAPTYTKTKYDMWQYKSTGRIGGISGDVDLNLSYLGY